MSSAKVIFTYKRKRLSSCSVASRPDFSSDTQVGRGDDVVRGTSDTSEKQTSEYVACEDPTQSVTSCLEPCNNHQCSESHVEHTCYGKKLSSACSPPRPDKSSISKETGHVERCDTTHTTDTAAGFHELSEANTVETYGDNKLEGGPIGKPADSSNNDSCLDLNSSSLHIDGCIHSSSVFQTTEKEADSLCKQSHIGDFETTKAKINAPLLTFSRRLKRKAEAGGDSPVVDVDRDCRCVLTSSCEVSFVENRPAEDVADLNVAIDDASMKSELCLSNMEMVGKDDDCPVGTCSRSCTETVVLKHEEVGTNITEDMDMDVMPTKVAAMRTSESNAIPLPATAESTKISYEDVGCPSSSETAMPCCNDNGVTNEHPVSGQPQQTSSGDSQLTSCDGPDFKVIAGQSAEQKAPSAALDISCSSPGAYLIDCNAVPESDLQEQTSDVIHASAKISENHASYERHLESSGLELFSDSVVQAKESSLLQESDTGNHVDGESKLGNTCLQLFSEDGRGDHCFQAGSNLEISGSKAHQNATYAVHSKELLERSSKKAAFLGLSLPTEPVLGETSKHGLLPGSHLRTRECMPNPGFPFFSDQSLVYRHKVLLESINTRATALIGNRNMPLDMFEPYPVTWSEEELDSLWIGIRRHGKGNWHAMLLDPRLHFAPWRVARDLAEQWEREQNKLLHEQHMPQGRYVKPIDPCIDHAAAFMGPGASVWRDNVASEIQLSLGDVYTRNIQPSKRGRKVRSKLGNYSRGLFNNNNMVRGDAPLGGPSLALAMNNGLSQWLGDPPLPPLVALTQTGVLGSAHASPEPSGFYCRPRNLVNNRVTGLMTSDSQPPANLNCSGPSLKKQGTTNNLIVIHSDASSEETISDDHNGQT